MAVLLRRKANVADFVANAVEDESCCAAHVCRIERLREKLIGKETSLEMDFCFEIVISELSFSTMGISIFNVLTANRISKRKWQK